MGGSAATFATTNTGPAEITFRVFEGADRAHVSVSCANGDSMDFTISGAAIRGLAQALPGPSPTPADIKGV